MSSVETMAEAGLSSFSFWAQLSLKFGPGTFRDLPARVREGGFRRPGVIVDGGIVDQPSCAEVFRALEGEFGSATVFANTVSEPDYDYLDTVAARFRDSDVDSLVAVGGGSTLDLAKGVSVLLTNPGQGIDYRGFNLVRQPGVPLYAVPTTAGTGSEVTPNAVFIDRTEQRKFGINTPLYVPKLSLLDPMLTLSCPKPVTVSSGMDALVHAIESYVAASATPMSRIFSREAFRLVFNTLEGVLLEPDNVTFRSRMLLGAHFAGIGLMNSGAGPAGAMSYPLGVHFKVPHGLAGAVFLAPVVRFNVERGSDVYADLYDLVDGAEGGLSGRAKSQAFCDRLDVLSRAAAVPSTLLPFGVTSADVPRLAEQTMLLGGALAQNPVPMELKEITSIINTIA